MKGFGSWIQVSSTNIQIPAYYPGEIKIVPLLLFLRSAAKKEMPLERYIRNHANNGFRVSTSITYLFEHKSRIFCTFSPFIIN